MIWNVVWDAVIALVAVAGLILSQLPPLRDLLRGARIRIFVPGQFDLHHFMGNVQFNVFLGVHNVGGQAVRISKVDCVMTSADGQQWNLPAETYYVYGSSSQPDQPPSEFLIGWIALKPEEDWTANVHCYKAWSEAEADEADEIISKIRIDTQAKLARAPISTQGAPLIEADAGLVMNATAFFERKFQKLSKGNYKLFIAVLAESNQILAVRGFDFTLYESHVRTLRRITDHYKFGDGLYFFTPQLQPHVWPRLRPLPDEEARKIYTKIRLE